MDSNLSTLYSLKIAELNIYKGMQVATPGASPFPSALITYICMNILYWHINFRLQQIELTTTTAVVKHYCYEKLVALDRKVAIMR